MSDILDENLSSTSLDGGKSGKSHPRRRTFGALIAFALVFGLLGLTGWGLAKSRRGPVDSGLAPDFTLAGYDGRIIALNS